MAKDFADISRLETAEEMNATNKRESVSKLMKAWESKNAKRAAQGAGLTLMAVTLAACGNGDDFEELIESGDLDNDNIPNANDLDIDGDGVPNGQDRFPENASEQYDADGDGIGNNADNFQAFSLTSGADNIRPGTAASVYGDIDGSDNVVNANEDTMDAGDYIDLGDGRDTLALSFERETYTDYLDTAELNNVENVEVLDIRVENNFGASGDGYGVIIDADGMNDVDEIRFTDTDEVPYLEVFDVQNLVKIVIDDVDDIREDDMYVNYWTHLDVNYDFGSIAAGSTQVVDIINSFAELQIGINAVEGANANPVDVPVNIDTLEVNSYGATYAVATDEAAQGELGRKFNALDFDFDNREASEATLTTLMINGDLAIQLSEIDDFDDLDLDPTSSEFDALTLIDARGLTNTMDGYGVNPLADRNYDTDVDTSHGAWAGLTPRFTEDEDTDGYAEAVINPKSWSRSADEGGFDQDAAEGSLDTDADDNPTHWNSDPDREARYHADLALNLGDNPNAYTLYGSSENDFIAIGEESNTGDYDHVADMSSLTTTAVATYPDRFGVQSASPRIIDLGDGDDVLWARETTSIWGKFDGELAQILAGRDDVDGGEGDDTLITDLDNIMRIQAADVTGFENLVITNGADDDNFVPSDAGVANVGYDHRIDGHEFGDLNLISFEVSVNTDLLTITNMGDKTINFFERQYDQYGNGYSGDGTDVIINGAQAETLTVNLFDEALTKVDVANVNAQNTISGDDEFLGAMDNLTIRSGTVNLNAVTETMVDVNYNSLRNVSFEDNGAGYTNTVGNWAKFGTSIGDYTFRNMTTVNGAGTGNKAAYDDYLEQFTTGGVLTDGTDTLNITGDSGFKAKISDDAGTDLSTINVSNSGRVVLDLSTVDNDENILTGAVINVTGTATGSQRFFEGQDEHTYNLTANQGATEIVWLNRADSNGTDVDVVVGLEGGSYAYGGGEDGWHQWAEQEEFVEGGDVIYIGRDVFTYGAVNGWNATDEGLGIDSNGLAGEDNDIGDFGVNPLDNGSVNDAAVLVFHTIEDVSQVPDSTYVVGNYDAYYGSRTNTSSTRSDSESDTDSGGGTSAESWTATYAINEQFLDTDTYFNVFFVADGDQTNGISGKLYADSNGDGVLGINDWQIEIHDMSGTGEFTLQNILGDFDEFIYAEDVMDHIADNSFQADLTQTVTAGSNNLSDFNIESDVDIGSPLDFFHDPLNAIIT